MKGIVWCVAASLWLVLVGLAAGNEPPPKPIPPMPPIPAPVSPVAQIVSVTESLAKMDVAAGRAFAWDLVQVLAKHEKVLAERKVEWPEALTALKNGPRPDAGASSDAERQRIYDQTEPLLGAANEMDPDRPPEWTCPAKLGVALLVVAAEKCPSVSACAAAASRLLERCLPDAEGRKPPLEELSPAVAARAYEVALGRAMEMLAKGPGEDAANGLVVAAVVTPLERYLLVDAMASGTPDAEAIRTRADVWLRQLRGYEWLAKHQAVQRAEDSAEIRRALETAIKAFEAVKAKAGQIAEMAVRTAAVDALAKKFLLAVNTENRAQALECLTAKSGEALAKAESLRAAFTGREDTKDVLYRGVGPAYGLGGREYVTVCYRIVDTAGRGASAAKEMSLVKTETGWLLGEP